MTSARWDPADFRVDVQSTLDTFLDEQARRLEPLGDDAARLLAEARRAVAGGKRFRAAFCYWGYRGVHDEPADQAALFRASSALELLHASALVHDDYMDSSDTRRGHLTTHKRFAAFHREHGWRGNREQYGAASAILLGDLLLSWSDQLLRTCGLDHGVVRDALGFFDTTRSEVITGQFLDVSVQARGASDVEQAMRVLRYKSAKYSIERPLHIGASLAGADAAMLEALTGFGLPLGEAFQLRDDLLGVFGDPATTGKPAGDDLVEGKRTVLVAQALEGATPGGAAHLDAQLGGTLTPEDIIELRRIITESGAQENVEKSIAALTHQALTALEEAPLTDTARAVLHDLAIAATQRVL